MILFGVQGDTTIPPGDALRIITLSRTTSSYSEHFRTVSGGTIPTQQAGSWG
jgi:hypothetical protein